MGDLIKAELFKLSKSLTYKILFICTVATFFTYIFFIAIGFSGIDGDGYEVFIGAMRYILHHSFVGYLLVCSFLCGEYTNRTISLGLNSGHSKTELLIAKLFIFITFFVLLFIIYTGIATLVVSVNNGGFGKSFNIETLKDFIVLLFCGVIGYTAVGCTMILTAIAVKKEYATIGIGLGIIYLLGQIDNLTRNTPLSILKYTYVYQIRHISWDDTFQPTIFMVVMAFTIILSIIISIILIERQELK